MLCDDLNCEERNAGVCKHYALEYMEFVTRRGYCPFVDDGPNKPVKLDMKGKKRVGQQKAKKK